MLRRRPRAIVPAQVPVQEGKRRVDAVVSLVPPLLPGELGPRGELSQLGVHARRLAIEQAREPVLLAVHATAPGAGELLEGAVAGRADDESGEPHRR